MTKLDPETINKVLTPQFGEQPSEAELKEMSDKIGEFLQEMIRLYHITEEMFMMAPFAVHAASAATILKIGLTLWGNTLSPRQQKDIKGILRTLENP